MSYTGVSVREAMEKINAPNSGWYLPEVQRQYVWGARYESETYICLLMDSLYREYPIGGLVLWETNKAVAHRKFTEDYIPGPPPKLVDKGLWSTHKCLVYDGQQRLQTLFSVLRHRFNGRVLCFDLLFDRANAEADETGFSFKDPHDNIAPTWIRMTELSAKSGDISERVQLERRFTEGLRLTAGQEVTVKTNLQLLWDVFVQRNIKSIAYYPVRSDDPKQVNEVFRRLNIGGITLTQNELVLRTIKAESPDFEEQLWEASEEIKKRSGGFEFSTDELLQFLFLMEFQTIRIDESRVKSQHALRFREQLDVSLPALREFFVGYLYDLLRINRAQIIPRKLALLPIMAYLVKRKVFRYSYEIKRLNTQLIDQYLILSQCCEWNTQTMVNDFAREAMKAAEVGRDFPLEAIKKIAVNKNRYDTLHYHQFLSVPWFALKVLTPSRQYNFDDSMQPQVDHVFPIGLDGKDDEYRARVNVLWNFQPLPAGLNNYKRAKHPAKEFFESAEGAKYLDQYDFLPPLGSPCWLDERRFIRYRHRKMRMTLRDKYGLKLRRIRQQQTA